MTSLKNYNLEEIVSSLSKTLNDENFISGFKTAEISKEATALENFKKDLSVATDLESVWNKHLPELTKEENIVKNTINQAVQAKADRAKTLNQPGQTVPQIQKADTMCECDTGLMACPCVDAVADFAIENIIKLADALDNNGFHQIADDLDDTLYIMAAKKGKKHKGRSYSEWVRHFGKYSAKAKSKFMKTFKGALMEAKKNKGLKSDKAEEYAMRVALSQMPKSYFKEHKKEKAPLTTKK